MARKFATDVKKKALFNFLFNGYYTDIFTIQGFVENTIKKRCLFRGILKGAIFYITGAGSISGVSIPACKPDRAEGGWLG